MITLNESKIVFLEEVLSWAKNTKIGLSLDIKNGFGFDNQVFFDTLTRVEAHDMVQQVIFLGWDHPNLLLLKKRNPEIKTRILIRGLPVNLVQVAQAAKADVVNLDADMVTDKEVKALHEEGIAVAIAETINPDYSRPVKLGADIICCCNPKEAREVIYEN